MRYHRPIIELPFDRNGSIMNCKEAREYWNLFFDSEGDSELFLKVNEHLEECSPCADWFEIQARLERTIRTSLRQNSTDNEVWSAIRQTVQAIPKQSPSRFDRGRSLLIVICLLMLLAVWRIVNSPSSETQWGNLNRTHLSLTDLATNLHDALLSGKQDIEFVSHSALEVEGYLHRKVNFPVRCPPRRDVGFYVDGAGTLPFGPNRAAYLVGKVEGEPVSIFILPKKSFRDFNLSETFYDRSKPYSLSRGDFELKLSTFDRNIVVVVGKCDSLPLEKVINAYGTYHDHDRG